MKKNLIFLLLFLVFSATAENITTLDGQTYLNSKVFDIRVDGIVINYVDSDNFNCLKFINFKNLPADIQEKYHYNKQAADKFDSAHKEWVEKQILIQKQQEKLNDELNVLREKIQQQIQDTAINIQFEARNTVEQGTEGHCLRIYPNGKQVDIGNILLLGEEFADKGSPWAGYVVPLNQNVAYNGEDLPCYAETDLAFQIIYNKEKQKLLNLQQSTTTE